MRQHSRGCVLMIAAAFCGVVVMQAVYLVAVLAGVRVIEAMSLGFASAFSGFIAAVCFLQTSRWFIDIIPPEELTFGTIPGWHSLRPLSQSHLRYCRLWLSVESGGPSWLGSGRS